MPSAGTRDARSLVVANWDAAPAAQHKERVSMCLTSVSYEPGDAVGFGWVAAKSGRGSTTVESWL
jgi:hypothetical protein